MFSLAKEWRSKVSTAQRQDWSGSSLSVWADESFQIATSPKTGYCEKVDNSCIYDSVSGRATFQGGVEKVVTLDKEYVQNNKKIIQQQLTKAGIRLASLLLLLEVQQVD